jgi:hypothetical protein
MLEEEGAAEKRIMFVTRRLMRWGLTMVGLLSSSRLAQVEQIKSKVTTGLLLMWI